MAFRKKNWLIFISAATVLTIIAGWLYQTSTGTLCYSKLGFVYIGNVLYWTSLIRPIQLFTQKTRESKHLLLTFSILSVVLVVINQLAVYGTVEGLFALLYNCQTGITLFEFLQTNHIVPNFLVFWVIIAGFHYQVIFQALFGKKEAEDDAKNDTIVIKQNDSTFNLSIADIVWIEADNNAVIIHTRTKKFVEYGRLKDWENRLASHGLIRVHKSYIINTQYIERYQSKPSGDGTAYLASGEKIKVSRNFKSNLRMSSFFILA